jgi:hypothetical protein
LIHSYAITLKQQINLSNVSWFIFYFS